MDTLNLYVGCLVQYYLPSGNIDSDFVADILPSPIPGCTRIIMDGGNVIYDRDLA